MLGCFGMAFNLPRMIRYFIVLAGAALANTFGLIDLAPNPDFMTYILRILINCVKYYIPCLGNCIWFVLLWFSCAESLFKLPVRKRPAWESFGIMILGGFVAYILFMIIGVMSSGIMLERYIARHRNTVFEEKLTGIIVFPNQSEYYDFTRKDFYDIPIKVRINKDFNSNNSEVKEQIAKKINLKSFKTHIIINDTMYYKDGSKLFSLHPPDYDKPELVLKKFNSYSFYVSPDERFIAYFGGVRGFLGRQILCVMSLKTKKILALKASHGWKIFWVKNLDELKMPKVTVTRKMNTKK